MDEVKFKVSLEGNLSVEADKGKASLDQLSVSIDKAQGKFVVLEGSAKSAGAQLGHLTPAAHGSAEGLGATAKGLGAVGGAAIAAVGGVVAVGNVLGELVGTALEVAETNEKLLATFDALGDTRAGKNTLEMLNELSGPGGLPQSRAQLAEWTKQLQATGTTDIGQLREELRATASAQAIMGDAGAAAYEKLREKVSIAVESHTPLKIATKGLTALYKAGLNIEDIAGRMGVSTKDLATGLKAGTVDAAKFGDAMRASLLEKGKRPLEVMGNEIGTLKTKGKETFGHLFDGIDTEPITDGIKGLILLGDQSQPSGRAIKDALGGGLDVVIKKIGSAMTEAQVFFLDVEILALESYIAMKPLIGAFETVAGYAGKAKDFLLPAKASREFSLEGPSAAEKGQDALTSAKRSSTLGMLGPVGQVLDLGGTALDMIRSMADDQARAVAHESGVTLGKEVISGIREGTDTHSPSPLVIGIGRSIGLSLGMGLEAAPEPARAARTVSGNAIGGLVRGAHGGAGGLFGGGGGLHIDRVDVHVTAPDGVTDATAITAFGLSVALERYQLAVGR